MATKIFCDACGKEGASNSFRYLCHLSELDLKMGGYVDNEGNPVSGREDAVDLCNKCYNVVLIPAMLKLRGLQEEMAKKV